MITNTGNSLKIAVVGAGIVGISSALALIKEGFRVCLIDPLIDKKAASYGNGCALNPSSVIPVTGPTLLKKAPFMLTDPNSPLFIRWLYFPKLLPWLFQYLAHCTTKKTNQIADALAPLVSKALDEHLNMAKGSDAEQYIRPNDCVYIYDSKAAFDADKFIWDIRTRLGVKWELLEGQAYDEYEPMLAGKGYVGARCPNHGHITDPGKYLESLIKHFRDLGGEFIQEQVIDVTLVDDKLESVRTTSKLIGCDSMVLSAGVWSKQLASKLGVKIPLESEGGYHIELIDPSFTIKGPTMFTSGKFIMTPLKGRLRCAGIVEFGGIDKPHNDAATDLLEKRVKEAFPTLTWKSINKWMGHRPSTPDSLPVIGLSDKVKNVCFAFGHQHVGLASGPITGKVVADIFSGRKPSINITPYSPNRF